MSKNLWSLVVGFAMLAGGLVLYVVFRDTETPVIGLRQTGFVLAALGVVELGATGWAMRSQGR
ncbi:DUF5708 family protein [Streptomyces sp. NPDC059063]|uniref:DUF5708 family protein n=1 Tax=unclassified Streptomyces TaxID=2593676 RepID=UPI0036A89E29